ncbi:MAG: hypothetical protein ACREJC_19710, partial [Tepidisphaeraceae bacterium]
MTQPAPTSSPRCHPHDSSESGALVLFLFAQAIVLAAATMRVPLWAGFPGASEGNTLRVLLLAQSILACLLFPALYRNATTAGVACLSCWSMVLLARLVAPNTSIRIGSAATYGTLWFVALWLVSGACRSQATARLVAGALAVYAIGGPLLVYLQAEFASAPLSGLACAVIGGPTTGALAQLEA